MAFRRTGSFLNLKEVAADASQVPEWTDYAEYCAASERGLRRLAFAVLSRFIVQMEGATFDDRRRFVSWLLHRADPHADGEKLAPHPLRTRVVEPTLAEWLHVDPTSSEPYRWLGGYQHLKRAIQLDPSDEIARRRFVDYVVGDVDYSTHELPYVYLGDATADLATLSEAEVALSGLPSDDVRAAAASEIAELRRLITEYLRRS